MKECLEKYKKEIMNKNLYIFFIIALFFFGAFSKMQFSTDTFAVIRSEPNGILNNFLYSGRIITAIFYKIFININISQNIVYLLSTIIAFIGIAISMYEIFKLLKNKIDSDILSILISTIVIINPFSIELFLYIEKGIMVLSILLCVLAVKRLIKYIEGAHNKELFISFLYMIVSLFSYQGTVAIFIVLSSVVIAVYSDNIKKFIKYNIIDILIYGIPSIINLFIIKVIFTGNRVSGRIEILEKTQKIVDGCKNMFNTYSILPKSFFMLSIIFILSLALISIMTNKKSKIIEIFKIIYIFIMTTVFAVLPQVLLNTDSIWFVSRSTYAFASILGALEMYLVFGDNINKKQIITKILIVFNIFFLLVQVYRFSGIISDHYKLNYIDKIRTFNIVEKISEYEQNTGNNVTKISIYKDENTRYSYSELFCSGDINISSFATDWSDINAINYYNNRNFEKVDNDEFIKEKLQSRDWDIYKEEKIIIEGNIAHIYVY